MPFDPYAGTRAYGFSQANARRIARITQYYEGQVRVPPEPKRQWGGYAGSIAKCAVTGSGGISAAVGTTLGSGTITISDVTPGTPPTLTPRTTTDTAYNNQTGAVSANSPIKVIWIDGYWFVFNGC